MLCDCFMKGFREFCPINLFVFFGKFEKDIAGQGESFKYNQAFTLIDQCIFIQMIEMKDTIGNFYNKFRLM